MRTMTLTMLVGVDVIVAVLMLSSVVVFAVHPDPAVKAGPMFVVLALMTVASVIMALLALNATYLPVLSRAQAANFSLVMWTMAATGTVTGLLTLGSTVNSLVMRLFIGSLAYAFIWMQHMRIARARTAQTVAPSGQGPTGGPSQTNTRSRQRRGGRKH
jgi:hypothetical protein